MSAARGFRLALVPLAVAVALDMGPGRARSDGLPAASAASAATKGAPVEPEIVAIALQGAGAFGGDIGMVTQVYRPAGLGPFPVLVFSHGRPGADPGTRDRLMHPIPSRQVAYWLGKGFAVVAAIRPGYGPTGGADAELNGARFDHVGTCTSKPAYRNVAEAATKAIRAVLEWVRAQPWADAQHIVLEGQSVGGFATVALAAAHPAGVIGYVNFAGGAGGNPQRAPGRSCDPEQIGALYAEFGKTTTLPNLWVYAENDQYWGPEAPTSWHAAFANGGSPTRFVHAPPVADGDGHGLSRHARSLWAPYLDAFVASLNLAPAHE
jgi:dienelactone hydrolase